MNGREEQVETRGHTVPRHAAGREPQPSAGPACTVSYNAAVKVGDVRFISLMLLHLWGKCLTKK